MKLKKEYLILLVLIVALGIYLALRDRDPSHMTLPQPEALDGKQIDRILVKTPEAEFDLVKKDDAWFMEPQGYKADPAQMTSMVDTIANLQLTALVSESESYERYNLSKADKILVQAFSGTNKVREFDVGQVAPTFHHTFIKLAGDSNVYHARGAFKNTFDHTISSLRDKTVFTFAQSGITTIEIQKGEHTLQLDKAAAQPAEEEKDADTKPKTIVDAKWQNAAGETVDQAVVGRLLGAMANLKCEDYLEDSVKDKLQTPVWTVTFKDASAAYTLSQYPKINEDDYNSPALSSTTPYVFALPNNQVESFEKQLDGLLGIEPAKEEGGEE